MSVDKTVVSDITIVTKNSENFEKLNKYPSSTTLCRNLLTGNEVNEDVILENINSSYPIIHHSVIGLIKEFIEVKKIHGSKIEKEIYNSFKFPITDFIDRIISKRPLVFVGVRDTYILRDNDKPEMAYDKWQAVGTDEEEPPLLMRDYLTYDEGKIAALIGASTKTVTINKGDRKNGGVPGKINEFENSGIIVGLVGPRMNKDHVMESQELRVTEDQNTKENGYGEKAKNNSILKLFANFYGLEYLPKFTSLKKYYEVNGEETTISGLVLKLIGKTPNSKNFDDYKEITGKQNTPQFLYIPGYNQRNRITFETLLVEANYRAKQMSKKAYVHVVGLALGVWRIYNGQVDLFTTEFVKTVTMLKDVLEYVSDIDFSWVINHGEKKVELDGESLISGDKIPGTNIMMHISQRNPWDKLPEEHQGKLIVASWAWDGMSFVGNEYWAGSLISSSDPAAACCTQIPELLNPYVNPAYCGKNTMVVTEQGFLSPVLEYISQT